MYMTPIVIVLNAWSLISVLLTSPIVPVDKKSSTISCMTLIRLTNLCVFSLCYAIFISVIAFVSH